MELTNHKSRQSTKRTIRFDDPNGAMSVIDQKNLMLTESSGTIWLSDLLREYADILKGSDCLINGLQLNSQKVNKGDVFVALPGLTTDGRRYIDQAISNGATAIIYEKRNAVIKRNQSDSIPVIGIENLKDVLGIIAARYFGNPSAEMDVIGITGTNGKTTTAYLITQALEKLGTRCGYSGTVGNGFINELVQSELTTLDAISVQAQLSDFLSNSSSALTMELSSHGLDQGRVNGTKFNIAVFTNLTQDHLDYHKSMACYGFAKQKLFEFDSLETAVINIDDLFGKNLLKICNEREDVSCITYGIGSGDLQAMNLEVSDKGIKFQIHYNGTTEIILSTLLGQINVHNLLATVGCLIALKYSLKEIAKTIPLLLPPPGRMEVFRNKTHQAIVVVDYAHTPDALERALSSLKSFCRGELVVVFGCGGDRDQGKRFQMGEVADRLADRIILTDDNPRSENPRLIVEQIKQGITRTVKIIHDRKAALYEAVKNSNQNDIVLLAGKGHEQTQTIGNSIRELSDRKITAEILEALK